MGKVKEGSKHPRIDQGHPTGSSKYAIKLMRQASLRDEEVQPSKESTSPSPQPQVTRNASAAPSATGELLSWASRARPGVPVAYGAAIQFGRTTLPQWDELVSHNTLRLANRFTFKNACMNAPLRGLNLSAPEGKTFRHCLNATLNTGKITPLIQQGPATLAEFITQRFAEIVRSNRNTPGIVQHLGVLADFPKDPDALPRLKPAIKSALEKMTYDHMPPSPSPHATSSHAR